MSQELWIRYKGDIKQAGSPPPGAHSLECTGMERQAPGN